MENEKNQSTTSEQAHPEALDDFDKVMYILSELPTDKAMQEISKGRIGPSIQKVVETMAMNKMDLVKIFRYMRMINKVNTDLLILNKRSEDVVLRWCKENPNHRIDIVATTPDDPERIIHD